MRLLLPAAVLCAFAFAAPAQNCASLIVSGSGLPGTDLSFAYLGESHAYAFVVIGDELGATVIRYGSLGTLTLGLAFPFLPVPMGRTNSSGDRTLSLRVPGFAPPYDLNVQAFDFRFTLLPFGLDLCTSNVVPVHIGL